MVDTHTRNNFIESNLPLVHSLCKRFAGRGIEYDDLYQAGCIGLIKALDNFNPDLNVQFSTYGVVMILGEIKMIYTKMRLIKSSVNVWNAIKLL